MKYGKIVSIAVFSALVTACTGGSSDVSDGNTSTSAVSSMSAPPSVSSSLKAMSSKAKSSKLSSARSSTSSMAIAPSQDQCDSTAQCRVTWPAATNCKDSQSATSVCLCGTSLCADTPQASSSAGLSSAMPSSKASSTSHSSAGSLVSEGYGAHPDAENPYRNKKYRIGDPGVSFYTALMDDPKYKEEKKIWASAGVKGGIPFIDKMLKENVKITVNGGDADDINRAINRAVDMVKKQKINANGMQPNGQYGGVAILLKNGNYTINKTVAMKNRVYLIGESRGGVRATLKITGGAAFDFADNTEYSGMYRMTIEGGWGIPFADWNQGPNIKDGTRNENFNNKSDAISIRFRNSRNHFVDKVNIYNSAKHPIWLNSQHVTIRDVEIDGAHLKGGGAEGYLGIVNGYNLLTGLEVTHLRHISIQGQSAQYNVMIDNDYRQEMSYHVKDSGNNLMEYNRIIIPEDMPTAYFPVMGPWSTQHGLLPNAYNYLYRGYNRMGNYKNGKGLNGKKFFDPKRTDLQYSLHALVKKRYQEANPKVAVPRYPNDLVWSDENLVYKGPVINVGKDHNHLLNFPHYDEQGKNYAQPKGNTFYPVKLK